VNSSVDAVAIVAATIVVLALIVLAAHAIKSDYQFTGSLKVAKRNPPPAKSPSGTAPASVTEIGRAS
jgi:hypothetical protein